MFLTRNAYKKSDQQAALGIWWFLIQTAINSQQEGHSECEYKI